MGRLAGFAAPWTALREWRARRRWLRRRAQERPGEDLAGQISMFLEHPEDPVNLGPWRTVEMGGLRSGRRPKGDEAMGVLTESNILAQAKKGQGETNERLDGLLVEMRKTNELLGQLLSALAPRV